MPISNSPFLFAGGAVKLDSSPSLAFYSQLMARRQAKMDAMNQYYSRLMDDVQGQENKMRPKDIEGGWQQKFNDWQMFYMNPENRKAILNPSKYGFEKANQFNAMHQDLIADARKSKKALEDEKTVAQHALSGKWIPTDNDMNEVNSLSKTIYDPSRKIQDKDQISGLGIERDPDVAYLSPNIPDPTAAEKNAAMKYATGNIKPSTTAGEPDRKLGLITYTTAYKPEDIAKAAGNYANTVAGDRKFMNSYDRLMHDPAHYKTYNEVYHKYFGKDIESPEEMAAAEAALHYEGVKEEKPVKWTDPMEWYRREGVRQINRKEMAGVRDYYKTKSEQDVSNDVDAFIDAQKKDAEKSPQLFEHPSGTEKANLIKTSPVVKEVFSYTDNKGHKYSPDDVMFMPNDHVRVVYYKYDKDGNVEMRDGKKVVDDANTRDMTRAEYKAALVNKLFQTKVKIGQIDTHGESKYLIKGKSYSESELIKMGYNKDQIAPYKQ